MYKVLIVDDSKLGRMSFAKALKALQPDWSLVEASGADEAVAVVARDPPDIAVLDFNMRGRDGLALAAELHARDPSMPLALTTANVQDEIVMRARALGAAFLPKPLTERALAEFLSAAQAKLRASAP
jgi:CheY-like chemotaxis protein